LRKIPNQWLDCFLAGIFFCKSINFAMHRNVILMIRIGIIGSNTKKNNKECVEFIVCKRILSVNIINRNIMQLWVNYIQVHVYFPVLAKLFQSLLHRQKSHLFRQYITSRHHTILTRLLLKMFSLNVSICNCRWRKQSFNDKYHPDERPWVRNFLEVFVVVQLWLRWAIHMNTYINVCHQLIYFMKHIYSLFYNIIHDMATTINMHTII
jgi:hypothetical protein